MDTKHTLGKKQTRCTWPGLGSPALGHGDHGTQVDHQHLGGWDQLLGGPAATFNGGWVPRGFHGAFNGQKWEISSISWKMGGISMIWWRLREFFFPTKTLVERGTIWRISMFWTGKSWSYQDRTGTKRYRCPFLTDSWFVEKEMRSNPRLNNQQDPIGTICTMPTLRILQTRDGKKKTHVHKERHRQVSWDRIFQPHPFWTFVQFQDAAIAQNDIPPKTKWTQPVMSVHSCPTFKTHSHIGAIGAIAISRTGSSWT